jgi:intraflagellar transport protein 80
MSLDWSSDSTLLSCACANGGVVFAQVVDRKVEWRNYECVLDENNHILVTDVLNEAALSASTTNPSRVGVAEDLEFGHAVLEMSIGWGHLIVITANKNCYIYNTSSFSTPHIFDTKGNISLILQTEKYFLLNDRINGLKVFTYEGKSISTPKITVQNTLFAKQGNIALSNDALAVIDRANPTRMSYTIQHNTTRHKAIQQNHLPFQLFVIIAEITS